MLALTSAVLQLVQLGVTILPEVIQAAQTEVALLTGDAAPSAEQQAAIDAALAKAHAALQAA